MFKKFLAAALLAVSFAPLHAADDDVIKTVTAALHTVAPSAHFDSVVPAPLPGFYQATYNGHVLYVSADGKYLIQGDIYDIPGRISLTERSAAALRKSAIAKIPASKQMTFAPANPKYTVTVFTDIDCPYCRQFHKQIAEYNKLGIAVNYVLFPLPFHKGADKKAEAVWCASDRNNAYTSAMSGTDPGTKTCANPVAELSALGVSIGVDGTPAIFSDDGTQVGGYVPPEQLAQKLDQLAQHAPVAAK